MEARVTKWGNSMGVLLSKRKLEELGIKKGDKIEINIISKKRIDGFGICKGAKPFKREKDEHEDLW